MKVWCVFKWVDYESDDVIEIFSSLDLANDFCFEQSSEYFKFFCDWIMHRDDYDFTKEIRVERGGIAFYVASMDLNNEKKAPTVYGQRKY